MMISREDSNENVKIGNFKKMEYPHGQSVQPNFPGKFMAAFGNGNGERQESGVGNLSHVSGRDHASSQVSCTLCCPCTECQYCYIVI